MDCAASNAPLCQLSSRRSIARRDEQISVTVGGSDAQTLRGRDELVSSK